MAISSVTVTYNEAKKLKDCLDSVKSWVDEIVIVDMGSTDETLKVAEKFGAKIYKEKLARYVELVRDSSIAKAKSDWILVIDPDERIPEKLPLELKIIAKKGQYGAVNIPRKNIIFGKWIHHTNWWPDYQIRFFKKEKISWSKKIHEYPEVNGKIFTLPAKEELAIKHLNYQTVSEFLDRQNRYTEIVAQNLYDQGVRFSFPSLCWRPLRVFLQRFFRHAGFLDGFHGLALSFLASYSQLATEVKLWEKTKKLS